MKRKTAAAIILTASIPVSGGRDLGMPYQFPRRRCAPRQASALELARYNILVNAILPGPFLTQ